MKKDEWFPFLSSLGFPCSYHHFEEGHSPFWCIGFLLLRIMEQIIWLITKEVKSDWSFIPRKKTLV